MFIDNFCSYLIKFLCIVYYVGSILLIVLKVKDGSKYGRKIIKKDKYIILGR